MTPEKYWTESWNATVMEVIQVVCSTKILDAFTQNGSNGRGGVVLFFNSQRFTSLLVEKIANPEVKASTISNIIKALVSKYKEIIPRQHTEVLKCTHSEIRW